MIIAENKEVTKMILLRYLYKMYVILNQPQRRFYKDSNSTAPSWKTNIHCLRATRTETHDKTCLTFLKRSKKGSEGRFSPRSPWSRITLNKLCLANHQIST